MDKETDQPHTIISLAERKRQSETPYDPQKRAATILMLARLSSHYYRPDFSQGQATLLVEDMADDLSEFTFAEIENAIRDYRRDNANKFYPRSGDLIALIQGKRKARATDAAQGDKGPVRFEFGDSRPLAWEYLRKQFWKPHWSADDLNIARDPQRRARYDLWLAAKGQSK